MKIVSIIIPCFNADRWIQEAIDSCLQQTYPHIEVIVIDDGSTDHSLDIIKRYGDRIRWESNLNRGGCYARNRGFALSIGDYIQYLDADDYILPDKIAKQVEILETSGADAVYGDWRYQKHLPNGAVFLDNIQLGGPKANFLESLLTDSEWIAPMAFLFTRAAVMRSGGWDEKLRTGQDRDFFISVALSGAKFHYQSGCESIYRRYGNVTVSTSSKSRWRNGHFALMQKTEIKLAQLGQLLPSYRQALAHSYYEKIRADRTNIDYSQYHWVLKKIIALNPDFKPANTKQGYSLLQKLFGFERTELIIRFVKEAVES
jgi:glycosyltransferase involved in cell wall biosynthesis